MREQRHSMRIPVHAAASVHAPTLGLSHHCTVDDLSLGGAHLSDLPPLAPGQRVHVEIRIPGVPDLVVTGRVVRGTPASVGVGVGFCDLPAQVEDAIHDLGLALIARDRDPALLVVNPRRRARGDLAHKLRALGWDVVPASTPLGTLVALQDPRATIGTALVHVCLTQTSGLELLAFIAREQPAVRRIAVGCTTDPSTAEDAVNRGLAHQALFEPVSPGALRAAVGPHPPRAPFRCRARDRPSAGTRGAAARSA